MQSLLRGESDSCSSLVTCQYRSITIIDGALRVQIGLNMNGDTQRNSQFNAHNKVLSLSININKSTYKKNIQLCF